jgi:ribonuclease III
MAFIEELAQKLELELINSELYEQAFTHKSLAKGNEHIAHNERLEYLGDAVLGLVVADYLFRMFPNDDEGQLSRKRASLVNESTLSRIAEHFDLASYLRAHHSQVLEDLQTNPRILASLFESIIGAMFIDLGFLKTRDWIEKVYVSIVKLSFDDHDYQDDYKTRFQELIQSRLKVTPVYTTIESTGPDHQRMFTVSVSVDGEVFGEGQGLSKKLAAQEAAKAALKKEETHG